jgi:hypothetical protein
VQRAALMSATLAGIRQRSLRLHADNLAAVQALTTALVLGLHRTGALPGAAAPPCDRRLLWRLGISGDRPLLLVSAGCHSLDSPLPGDRDGNPSTLCDRLAAADGAEPPSPMREELLALLEHLDARGQRLIRAHYGLDESAAGIHELAKREGISAHRVRNALKLAEYRLRKLSGVDPAVAIRPAVPAPIPDVAERAHQLELPGAPAPAPGPGPA